MVAERHEPEPARRRWTKEEYLAFERAADEKHEMIDGRVFLRGAPEIEIFPDEVPEVTPPLRAMAGATFTHNCIVVDAVAALKSQLRGSTCQPFATDLRVQIGAANDYVYPDIVVACEPQLASGVFDTLLNPNVVIEVLSPSTADYDRTEKWERYQVLPSLRDYVLISTATPRVELYSRRDDGSWLFRVATSLQESIALESIHATLSLSEIYERVTFETREYSQETS